MSERRPAVAVALEVAQDLGEPEHADRDRHEIDAVGEFGMSKVKRGVPVSTSVPTRPSSRPSTIIASAFSTEPWASATEQTRPSTISEKYSGGPNLSATPASGGANTAITTVATVPAKKEPSAAMRERGSCAALPGHLVAVDAVTDRRGFARQVDQDRRGGAAVLRAVVDAGQHDEGRHRRQWKVIGSSIAMVAVGPMPGSTPISVPRRTPKKQ